MKNPEWQAYTTLAWTDAIIAPPETYVKETEYLCKIILKELNPEIKSMLHLSCGAGGNDYTLKKYFKVTCVDLCEQMLSMAMETNPEIEYIQEDMRTLELNIQFDAVIIPDSIDHIVTIEDLRKTLQTAHKHLKPGGFLLIIGNIKEEFGENNFVYTGKKGDIEITLFENNYIPRPDNSTYEATLAYFIRKKGKLEVYNDHFTLGLFELETWLNLFKDEGFEVSYKRYSDTYGSYVIEEGEYPLFLFICKKIS